MNECSRTLTVYDVSAELASLPAAIIQRFNFTEDESSLCLGLVQGRSFHDLADDSCQPREQLRHDYKNVLKKAGVDTEAKLVTVILARA